MLTEYYRIKNEVIITEECAEELLKADPESMWYEDLDYLADYVDDGLKLFFDEDQMEHMDFISYKKIQAILKKHKVKGDICFTSSAGDYAGSAWGYRFDGEGGMKTLSATLVWTEDE